MSSRLKKYFSGILLPNLFFFPHKAKELAVNCNFTHKLPTFDFKRSEIIRWFQKNAFHLLGIKLAKEKFELNQFVCTFILYECDIIFR